MASAFCVAFIVYPFDLIRALKMSNAGTSLSTTQLLANFKSAHGWQGFFTQVQKLCRHCRDFLKDSDFCFDCRVLLLSYFVRLC